MLVAQKNSTGNDSRFFQRRFSRAHHTREKTALRQCLARAAPSVLFADKLCLWNGRALFIGRVPDLDFHSQAAALICVALEKPFALTPEGAETQMCRSALIGPQTLHALRPGGSVCAFLFIDPDNTDYDLLLKSNRPDVRGITTPLQQEHQLFASLQQIVSATDTGELCALLRQLELAPPQAKGALTDERIQRVVQRLISEPGESIPIESLAASVDISPSRLAHLFKDQVGVPIRMFRTWFRLKTAVVFLKEGMSLTDAALRAGFYDSAHFANTFRETFGLPPSVVFSPQRALHWHIEPADLISVR